MKSNSPNCDYIQHQGYFNKVGCGDSTGVVSILVQVLRPFTSLVLVLSFLVFLYFISCWLFALEWCFGKNGVYISAEALLELLVVATALGGASFLHVLRNPLEGLHGSPQPSALKHFFVVPEVVHEQLFLIFTPGALVTTISLFPPWVFIKYILFVFSRLLIFFPH